jgi:hypothetical protein
MLGSGVAVVVEEVVLAGLFAEFVLLPVLVVLSAVPQPASPRTITARIAANFIFIELFSCYLSRLVKPRARLFGLEPRRGWLP